MSQSTSNRKEILIIPHEFLREELDTCVYLTSFSDVIDIKINGESNQWRYILLVDNISSLILNITSLNVSKRRIILSSHSVKMERS